MRETVPFFNGAVRTMVFKCMYRVYRTAILMYRCNVGKVDPIIIVPINNNRLSSLCVVVEVGSTWRCSAEPEGRLKLQAMGTLLF